MSREPFFRRKTAISYKTEEKTVMRGYDLSELAEEGYSFCDALFVLYQGRIPTEARREDAEVRDGRLPGALHVALGGGRDRRSAPGVRTCPARLRRR